jgi:hypothetical protein
MAEARFYMLTDDVPEPVWMALVLEGWEEETRPELAATGARLLRRDVQIETPEDLHQWASELKAQAEGFGVPAPDVTAVCPAPEAEAPAGDLPVYKLMPDSDLSTILTSFPKPPSNGGKPPEADAAKAPQQDAPDPPPAAPDQAAILHQAGLLVGPAPLWEHADEAEANALAKDLMPDLYALREKLASRAEWLVAPEAVLLDLVGDETKKRQLATAILATRTQTTSEDQQLRVQRVKMKEADVTLAGQRNALAATVVLMAREALEHMRKWKNLADSGIKVLWVTVGFSLLAVTYLLTYLVPGGKVSDAAIPVVIFVLALFAISPAVLLLNERPLKGLDKWAPAAAADKSSDDAAAKATADAPAAPASKSADGKAAAATTTTTTTTSS